MCSSHLEFFQCSQPLLPSTCQSQIMIEPNSQSSAKQSEASPPTPLKLSSSSISPSLWPLSTFSPSSMEDTNQDLGEYMMSSGQAA